VCPGDIIHLTPEGPDVRYPDECSHCGLCVTECPVQAVEIRFSWNMLQLPIQLTRREHGTDA
jgi:ferredoxin